MGSQVEADGAKLKHMLFAIKVTVSHQLDTHEKPVGNLTICSAHSHYKVQRVVIGCWG
jgi:hypothetical protein